MFYDFDVLLARLQHSFQEEAQNQLAGGEPRLNVPASIWADIPQRLGASLYMERLSCDEQMIETVARLEATSSHQTFGTDSILAIIPASQPFQAELEVGIRNILICGWTTGFIVTEFFHVGSPLEYHSQASEEEKRASIARAIRGRDLGKTTWMERDSAKLLADRASRDAFAQMLSFCQHHQLIGSKKSFRKRVTSQDIMRLNSEYLIKGRAIYQPHIRWSDY